jgi:hypothetical protein
MSAKRNDFKRQTNHRGFIGERFLIACEGESEKLYFEALRDVMRNPSISVKIINENHRSDPLQVVNKVKEVSAIKNKKSTLFEHIWVIIDADVADRFEKANESAIKLGIFVGYSNPCFELWLMLHYKNQSSFITCEQTIRLLREENSSYDKTNNKFFKNLVGDIEKVKTAIKNSKLLQSIHVQNGNLKQSNPSTSVYELVGKIVK